MGKKIISLIEFMIYFFRKRKKKFLRKKVVKGFLRDSKCWF